jgi:hypothetical protein
MLTTFCCVDSKLRNPFGHSRRVDSLPKCLLEINVISVGTWPWILHHTEPVLQISIGTAMTGNGVWQQPEGLLTNLWS